MIRIDGADCDASPAVVELVHSLQQQLTAAHAEIERLTRDKDALMGALKFPERENSFALYMLREKVREWADQRQADIDGERTWQDAEDTIREMREAAHD